MSGTAVRIVSDCQTGEIRFYDEQGNEIQVGESTTPTPPSESDTSSPEN